MFITVSYLEYSNIQHRVFNWICASKINLVNPDPAVQICFTSAECHGNCHLRFGHRIHGTGDQGCLQGDLLGEGAHEFNLPWQEVNVARQEDEVIVSQALPFDDQLGACNQKQ